MTYFIKTNVMYQNTLTDWLHENKIDDYSFYASAWNTGCKWLFEFKNEEDALAFKLKWA